MPDFLDVTKSGVLIARNRQEYVFDILPDFQRNGSERRGSKVYQDKDGRRIMADIYCFPSGSEFIIGYYQPEDDVDISLGALLDEIAVEDE
ncbi:MAG: hypothetical protein K8S27_04770 [Candidatus Omnitrophica bacterium]|nr:hypothetical protein [Candidatus Omnitrophota bacterium]